MFDGLKKINFVLLKIYFFLVLHNHIGLQPLGEACGPPKNLIFYFTLSAFYDLS